MTVAGGTSAIPQRASQPTAAPIPVQGKKTVSGVVSDVFNKGNLPLTSKNQSNTWGSGGLLSDIADIFNTSQMAATGLISGQKSVGQSVKERFMPSQAMKIEGTPQGLAADIFLDPLNLAAGVGLVGKGVRALGYADKAADIAKISKLGTLGIVKKGVGKVLGPTLKTVGAKIEPVARRVLQGIEPLSEGQKLRVGQIAKGSESISQTEDVLRKAAKPMGEVISETLDNFPVFGTAKRILTKTLPESYLGAKTSLAGKIATRESKAVEVGEYLAKGLTKVDQDIVRKLMAGDDVLNASEKLTTIASLGRRSVDSLSTELAEEMLRGGFGADKVRAAKSILENVGAYVPREFNKYVLDPKSFADLLISGDKKRLVTTFLKHRKELDPETIKLLGGLAPTGYSVAKRMGQVGRSIETSKFFRWVNKNFSSMQELPDYVKLSDSPNLGVLAGKYVPKMIASDVNSIGRIALTGSEELNKAYKGYRKMLGWWKEGKVILNPATQARNFMSNLILMDMGDFPVFSPKGISLFKDALTSYLSKGKTYKLAKKAGLFGGTYFGAEIKPLLKAFDEIPENTNLFQKVLGVLGKGVKAGEKSYLTVEETSKLAMFTWRLSEGDKAVDAARYAKKWLFDYEKVPSIVSFLRNMPFGFPFVTFTYKAIPRIGETLLKNPTKFTKFGKIFRNIEEMQPGARAGEEGLLPDYIRNGQYVRLPFQDKNGNSLYLDMNYILPWGMFQQSQNELLPGFSWPSDPMATIVQGITSGVNPFTQQTIYKDTDSPDQKLIKNAQFIYQTLMPALAPEIPLTGIKGGYSYEKIKNALFGKPDRYGTVRELPTTFLDVGFGLKTVPISPEAELPKRTGEYKRRVTEIKATIRNIARDQSITNEEERQRQIEKESQKLQQEGEIFGARLEPVK